jgi:alkylhydroperoxidase family enzyme
MAQIRIPDDHDGNTLHYVGTSYVPELYAAASGFSAAAYVHSKLSLREAEGARMRTALINGCTLCQNSRAGRDLPGYLTAIGADASASIVGRGDPVPDEAFYRDIIAWQNSPLYSDRERLMIELAERMGEQPRSLCNDQAF